MTHLVLHEAVRGDSDTLGGVRGSRKDGSNERAVRGAGDVLFQLSHTLLYKWPTVM